MPLAQDPKENSQSHTPCAGNALNGLFLKSHKSFTVKCESETSTGQRSLKRHLAHRPEAHCSARVYVVFCFRSSITYCDSYRCSIIGHLWGANTYLDWLIAPYWVENKICLSCPSVYCPSPQSLKAKVRTVVSQAPSGLCGIVGRNLRCIMDVTAVQR